MTYTKAEKVKILRKKAADLGLTFTTSSVYSRVPQSYMVTRRSTGVRLADDLSIDDVWNKHLENDFMDSLKNSKGIHHVK